MLLIEPLDLRKNRKRRIIHDATARRVTLRTVIPARIKRAHHVPAIHAILLRNPRGHSLINIIRRITVIRSLLRLELVNELVIFIVAILVVIPVLRITVEPPIGTQLKPKRTHVNVRDLPKLNIKLPQIPFSKLPDTIVRKPERLHLLRGQIICHDNRHRIQTELLRSLHPSVTSDNHTIRIHNNRNLETEFLDASGYSIHRTIIKTRIIHIRDQTRHIPVLHFQLAHEYQSFLYRLLGT